MRDISRLLRWCKTTGMRTNSESSAQIIGLVCFIALGTPFLFGYGTLPLTNFAGEIVGAVGFAMLLVMATQYEGAQRKASEPKTLQLTFGLMILVVLVQYLYFGQKSSMTWVMLFCYVILSGIAAWVGYAAHSNGYEQQWLRGTTVGLLIACCIASIASIVQYFGLDGSWFFLSPAAQIGRTFGFIRQPNHQATFLCLGVVAILTLQRLLKPKTGTATLVLLIPLVVFGVVSTGSRTAFLELSFVSAFAIYYLRREKYGFCKAIYPIVWAVVIWVSLYYVSQQGGAGFYGANKLAQTNSEGAGVRVEVWRQTWDLIASRPWFGFGLPYYTSAFYLSGGAASAGIIMTHSHNLFLQFAFGFGIPLTLVFFILVASVLWRARGQAETAGGFFAFAFIGCVFIHSQVEFPLWYTYFLLPVCYCLGWLSHASPRALSNGPLRSQMPTQSRVIFAPRWTRKVAPGIGAVIVGMAAWMNHDYYAVTPVFTPGLSADLEQRMQNAGQGSWFQPFVQFLVLNREKVTVSNYKDHLIRASELGCAVPESWYQPNTIVALAFAERLDEAKWILHSYAVLGSGKMDIFKKALIESHPPLADEMLQYLDVPKPVPKAIQIFETACYSSKHV